MGKRTNNIALAAVKVSGHLLYEKLTRQTPRTLKDIPRSALSVTPEWMTAVLCGNTPGARVIDVVVSGGSLGSHERRSLALTYNDAGRAAGLPEFVFTKTLPSLVTRMLVGFMGHARTEMLFYTRVRPELTIETPICYYSASDKTSFAAIHVLEDVHKTKGASFGDEKMLVTREQADSLVDLLADLHGPYYGSPRLETEFRWLANYPLWFKIGIEKVQIDQNHRKAIAAAADVIPSDLMARRNEIWPATMSVLEAHNTHPRTILHSDVHIANWYRTSDGRMGLLDWQCINQGLWARDFSYALTTCLTIENRRLWERDLLQRYLERMERHSGQKMDFDDSWTMYRQQVFHALTMWTQTLCHPLFQPNSHDKGRILELIRRITTAMSDLKSLDSL